MLEDNKDKLPDSEQDTIKTLVDDAKKIKDNTEATKDEMEDMIKKIEAELQTMMGKFQATDNTSHASPADMVEGEEGAVDGEVIDADK
jgi:uncharacterized membrane protein YukC